MSFDKYYWRLFSVPPYAEYDISLSRDLQWINEFNWSPITHDSKYTLSGSLIIHESKKTIGRPIELVPLDDMAWIKRSLVKSIYEMVNEEALVMTLEFTNGTLIEVSHNVIFDHGSGAFEVESAKRFDGFDNESWFKIKKINFIEVVDSVINPCT